MDFGIQKSVELGVSAITPLYSEHGEVKIKQPERLTRKLQHWQRIAVNAAEQCGRLDVPEIHEPIEVANAIADESKVTQVLFDASGDIGIEDIAVGDSLAILTGPEGGFAPRELEMARERDCQIVKLGPRILRTETAPLAALAILQNRFGDL